MREASKLERFPNLLELNLSYNGLSELDSLVLELAKLKSLRTLNLRGNKFNTNFNFDQYFSNTSTPKSLEVIEQ